MAVHEFDAGDLDCAGGFAQEFRRRIEAIPVGDLLIATVRDPSAKTDLPPLTRMMGHQIHQVEELPDGRIVFTVERGR
jgi:TusA-related sulfurtransferase